MESLAQELTEAELDELEHVARPATPGPWTWADSYTLVTPDGAGVLTKRRNREYVAAWSPDVALRVLEELRFLRRLEQIRAESTPAPGRRTMKPLAKRRG